MKFKDKMVKDAILLQCKTKVIEEGNEDSAMGFRFDVDGRTVRIFKRPGRRMITCTCPNGTRYCGSEKNTETSICKHKIAAILEWIKLSR